MSTPAQLTFLSWVRPELSDLVTAQSGGRAQAAAPITLIESDGSGQAGRTVSETLQFLVAGPADVATLQPGAVVRRYPAPGTLDHESDRCPYVELADPTLPWRYTPAPTPGDASLHPWLVLVVGLEGSELTLSGGRASIEVSAQTGFQSVGAPSTPYRFAHVQESGGHRTTRLLSARPLEAGTEYLAVVVPAFDAAGVPSWSGAAAVNVPAYDFWRFRTAVPAGSFEDLAARLHPGDAPASTGRSPLRYPRVPAAPELSVLGALVGKTDDGAIVEDPLPQPIGNDLAALRLPARDQQGRPIVTLPRYGEAWNSSVPDAAAWGKGLNLDPRHRGTAGLGLELGIRTQDSLIEEIMGNLGALHEARQRVRHLTLGLAASRSLWRRRVPADPDERLWLLGPSLGRLLTTDGSVGDLATADARTMPRGTFSAAARRVLRAGPARTAIAAAAPAPGALLTSANRQPPAPTSGIDGIPVSAGALRTLDQARLQTIDTGHANTAALLTAATSLAAGTATSVRASATQAVAVARQASQAGKPVPWVPLLANLAAADSSVIARTHNQAGSISVVGRGLGGLHGAGTVDPADADMLPLLIAVGPLQANDPSLQPVAVDTLAAGVSGAFDPSGATASSAQRVLATISGGVDPAQPLAPPEPCVGLDRPAWEDLAGAYPEWLLPGIGQLADDCIIGLESNAIFIDAYLAGLNTQLLSELRWRNIPIAAGCTPIRRFWDRADASTGERADDVVGLVSWPADSALGDASHRAPGATGRELVIAVRGQLLLRYPTTLVYLQSAVPFGGTAADFDHDPDDAATRVLPAFHGRIGADVTFYGFPSVDETALGTSWLVLEEPPAGYRFRNDAQTSALTGHDWAIAMLVQPVRVLIRGDSLGLGGTQ